jgi:alkylation response protein AidB-like acyl-CoA dehydrogenase
LDFSIPDDLKMVQTLARDFVEDHLIPLEKEILGRESDLEGAKRHIPADKLAELVKIAKETGLWGAGIPDELGGAGLGVLGTCLVEEELAKSVLPFRLGDVTPILFDCNLQQRSIYLVPAVEGLKTLCLALFEPGRGVDPAALETQACKSNGGYVLNGKKTVYNAGEKCDFAIVFAVTDPGKGPREGITCFLVDDGTPGFSVLSSKTQTGWRAQVAEPAVLTFNNCHIAATQVLGQEGKAFYLGRKWLPARRIIRGARCLGAALRILDKAVEHAKSWTSFGQTISGWPAVLTSLAEMDIDIKAARLLVYQAACSADSGQAIFTQAAAVKIFTTEMLKRVADRAVLIKSGPGPVSGLPLEYLCQSMLVQNILERALEAQKFIVANNILKAGKIL